jgi:hypothetical protein
MADDLLGLRAQAEALLRKADASPSGAWSITADEHETLVKLAEAFNLELPLVTFRSAAGVSGFLRLVLAAMRGA